MFEQLPKNNEQPIFANQASEQKKGTTEMSFERIIEEEKVLEKESAGKGARGRAFKSALIAVSLFAMTVGGMKGEAKAGTEFPSEQVEVIKKKAPEQKLEQKSKHEVKKSKKEKQMSAEEKQKVIASALMTLHESIMDDFLRGSWESEQERTTKTKKRSLKMYAIKYQEVVPEKTDLQNGIVAFRVPGGVLFVDNDRIFFESRQAL